MTSPAAIKVLHHELADSRAAKNFYLSFAETAGLEYVGNVGPVLTRYAAPARRVSVSKGRTPS